MPTYEYECKKCNKRFEVFQNIKEKPLQKCPVCKAKVSRLISSGSGLIFKGQGFYATDYRSQGYKQKEKEESKKSSSSKEPKAK